MFSRLAVVSMVITLLGLAPREERPPEPGPLEEILRSHPQWFGAVLENADRHRLQILYTRIDRDPENRPLFRSFGYRLSGDYFYPASTVKLPAAILALEKLNDLDVPGLGRDTPLRIGAAAPGQTTVEGDPTSADGRPTIAHYVRKAIVVSDNDAYNRLYEFVGQREMNERLWSRGFPDVRILRRLESRMGPFEERETNAFVFFDGEPVIYRQLAARNPHAWRVDRPAIRQGLGYVQDGGVVPEPLDFRYSNYLSLESLQGILRLALFPESVAEDRRFRLTEDDCRFLYRQMSMLPRESTEVAYPDGETHPDSYVKFFLFGDSAAPIPDGVRIFNKVGQAYGYLVDNAYVVDFDAGVEFLLTAVVQCNRNRIYNDDHYEYDEVGFPFLANLGRAVYRHELGRERPRRPDLSRFRLDD